ncbi:MAG TPA: hypothetical protein VIJ50_06415 [Solirubrobacteraceae bacterium]
MPSEATSMDLRLAAPDVYWKHAWDIAGDRYPRASLPTTAGGEARIRRELLFCLLGGHAVSYELNESAADVLWRRGVFRHWHATTARLESELSRPQFEPRRSDGTPRRYRYPARKARLLTEAARWLSQTGPLFSALLLRKSERARRALLCECPGMGPKSASWLLRNCGMAARLAILDVHVLRVMRESGRIDGTTKRDTYNKLEQTFVTWCDDLGADPAGFDLLLWEWSRTSAR